MDTIRIKNRYDNHYSIETWVPVEVELNGEMVRITQLKTIHLGELWSETFAHWDCLVDTDLASKIATAVVDTIIENTEE